MPAGTPREHKLRPWRTYVAALCFAGRVHVLRACGVPTVGTRGSGDRTAAGGGQLHASIDATTGWEGAQVLGIHCGDDHGGCDGMHCGDRPRSAGGAPAEHHVQLCPAPMMKHALRHMAQKCCAQRAHSQDSSFSTWCSRCYEASVVCTRRPLGSYEPSTSAGWQNRHRISLEALLDWQAAWQRSRRAHVIPGR